MNPIEISCRVVCVDARFPEIAYHRCQFLPRSEGVYTVTGIGMCPNVIDRSLQPALQLGEFQQPCRGKPGVPWFLARRFRRLDAVEKPDLLVADTAHV